MSNYRSTQRTFKNTKPKSGWKNKPPRSAVLKSLLISNHLYLGWRSLIVAYRFHLRDGCLRASFRRRECEFQQRIQAHQAYDDSKKPKIQRFPTKKITCRKTRSPSKPKRECQTSLERISRVCELAIPSFACLY